MWTTRVTGRVVRFDFNQFKGGLDQKVPPPHRLSGGGGAPGRRGTAGIKRTFTSEMAVPVERAPPPHTPR